MRQPDTVWAKSDIDLALITIDDKKVETTGLSGTNLALYAGGVNIHAFLMPRAEFRRTVEGAVRTHDETIAGLFARLREIR